MERNGKKTAQFEREKKLHKMLTSSRGAAHCSILLNTHNKKEEPSEIIRYKMETCQPLNNNNISENREEVPKSTVFFSQ